MNKFSVIALIFFYIFLNSCGSKINESENINLNNKVSFTSEYLENINQQLQKDPNNPSLYNSRAQYFLSVNNIDSAFRDINQALLLDSNRAAFFVTLSDIYMASGMIQNTLAALEKALIKDPRNTEALLKRAELHLYFNEYNKVLELTEKVINIESINPKAYFIRGMTYKLRGDTANALKNIHISIDQDQENYNAYIQLGLIYAAKSNALAIEYYNNALNIVPNSIEAMYNLAYFYQEHDMLNEALAMYSNIVVIDSTYKYAHYNMGFIHLVYLEMFRESIQYFSKAIKADPNYAEAYYNRGYSYELLGDIHNARADYHRALDVKTNYQMAIDGLNRLDR